MLYVARRGSADRRLIRSAAWQPRTSQLDESTSVRGTTVRQCSARGTHTLEFWSTDQLGNAESPHKRASFRIRPVPCKVTMTRTPAGSVITRYAQGGVARYALAAKVRRPNGAAFRGREGHSADARGHDRRLGEHVHPDVQRQRQRVQELHEAQQVTRYYRWYVPAVRGEPTRQGLRRRRSSSSSRAARSSRCRDARLLEWSGHRAAQGCAEQGLRRRRAARRRGSARRGTMGAEAQ